MKLTYIRLLGDYPLNAVWEVYLDKQSVGLVEKTDKGYKAFVRRDFSCRYLARFGSKTEAGNAIFEAL